MALRKRYQAVMQTPNKLLPLSTLKSKYKLRNLIKLIPTPHLHTRLGLFVLSCTILWEFSILRGFRKIRYDFSVIKPGPGGKPSTLREI